MPTDSNMTPVDVITQHCHYAGHVSNRGHRITDVLSDSRTDMLEMYETLTSVAGTGLTDVRWRQIHLKKDRILLVIPKGSYEAPVRRRNNYVAKFRFGVMIILPGHILSGVLRLSSRVTPNSVLDEESSLPTFMGVTDVTVHNSLHGLCPAHCDTVIVRRQAIEAIQLTSNPLSEPAAAARTVAVTP